MVITYNGRTITLPDFINVALRVVETVGKIILLAGVFIVIGGKMLLDLFLPLD